MRFEDALIREMENARGGHGGSVALDDPVNKILHGSDASRPALIVTNSGSPAVMSLVRAQEILIGCFANFSALLRVLRRSRGAICLVPAASPTPHPGRVEDEACAAALKAALLGVSGAGPRAVAAESRTSGRR